VRNGKKHAYEAAAEVEGTPTGGSGTGANWTADLRHIAAVVLNDCAGHDLLGVPAAQKGAEHGG
jgi:hypothetical protein